MDPSVYPIDRSLPLKKLAGLALAVALSLSAGCQGETPDKPAGNPQPSAEPDQGTRLIALKNRLQADPHLADTRLNLGLLLAEMSNPRDAESELSKAVELGMDPNLSVPPLARVWNTLGRSKEVIATYGKTRLTQPAAAAELLAEVAVAYSKIGNPKLAREAVAQAMSLDPNSVGARLVQAQVDLADNQVEQAMKNIDLALAGQGRKEQAWELKGDVLAIVKGDAAGGRAAYQEALKASPRHTPAQAKMVMLALDRKDLKDAQQQLAQLERIAPGSPPALYLAARLAAARGNLIEARVLIQKALTDFPNDLRSLILGAEIELSAGALRVAEEHLSNALAVAPSMPRIRFLLAQTYLRAGAPEKAEMILEPLVRARDPDPNALGLAAEAALQAGLNLKSSRLFELAAAADPANPRYRMAIALNRISRGDTSAGFAELESIAVKHPSAHVDMALLSARLQQGDTKGAAPAAERLAAKRPDSPMPYLVLGRLSLQDGNIAAARKHFEKALERDPAFAPAALALANQDLQEGAMASARQRIERVLQHAPNNPDALLAAVDIQRQAGDPPEKITASLEAAVRQQPGLVKLRLALVNHLIHANLIKEALVTAQGAMAQFPDDLSLIDALGRAQVAAGDSAQALSTFRRIVTLRPRAPEPLLRMADVYVARNEVQSAVEHYEQALALSPDLIGARIKLIGLQTVQKDWRKALAGARSIQAKLPRDPAGFHLEGLVLAAQQQWDPALGAFKAALERGPSADAAIEMHKTLLRAKRVADASRFGTDWIKAHPSDHQFTGYFGEMAMAARDYALAETQFRAIVKREPRNVRTLNNLAWVLLKQGKPGAVDAARSAAAAEPMNANVLDTLAMALSGENKDAEALETQKLAVAMAPKLPLLRLNLARLAIKSKDFALARTSLDQLATLGKEFPEQAAVWELRQQLR